MARQKALWKYPRLYGILFAQAWEAPRLLTFSTREEAKRFRNQLYNYRAVLRRNTSIYDPHNYAIIQAERIKIRLNGTTLTLERRKTKHDT